MSEITENVRKKSKLNLYNLSRKYYLKKVAGKLGKIIEEDDKIIVYATQRLVEKNSKCGSYNLRCEGMNTYNKKLRKKIEKYKLNKPVDYIFDGIVFDSFVNLSSCFGNVNVKFKNCTFIDPLRVSFGNNVTLENNNYLNWRDYDGYRSSFLLGDFGELNIKNDEIVNTYENKKNNKTRFGMVITANKVNIVNSNICAESQGKIDIKSKEVSINYSTIVGPEIILTSDSITSNNSLLKSNNNIVIKNENWDFSGDVQAPIVVYNEYNLNTSNEIMSVSEDDINLMKSRQKLLQTLHNLNDYCQQINKSKACSIEKELNSQPVSKVLKK